MIWLDLNDFSPQATQKDESLDSYVESGLFRREAGLVMAGRKAKWLKM
ncbi:MAG: hypothetical protein IJ632_00545 [Muribaculaceae bacterium]|nr:hypothetical protein [Muribaculaceae bacterium]